MHHGRLAAAGRPYHRHQRLAPHHAAQLIGKGLTAKEEGGVLLAKGEQTPIRAFGNRSRTIAIGFREGLGNQLARRRVRGFDRWARG